jgi:predicted phage terminase large subunit-like protein
MLVTQADLLAIERELCKRKLSWFVRRAWPVLEPFQKYIHGWHIDVVCEHLEAVTRGQINRLLVNIPPGTMKSMLIGVFWPAWEWGPMGMPAMRYVTGSHSENFATRDALKMRRLVESEWYQKLWPNVKLTGDQNEKKKFENTATGFRHAAAMSSMTGSRGDRVIIDDPHSVEGAISDKDRETTIRIFKETIPTRVNNPDKSAIVVVMQRLHERDVSGLILSENLGYTHLMLPMEFEPDRACVTCLGRADQRTEPGELLFPDRFPREVVERDKRVMGSMAVAGQFQQRPTPRGGGMIKAERLEIGEPGLITSRVRYWDKAGTHGGGAYTAGVLMGRDKEGVYWVLDVVRGQWSAMERERVIQQTAQLDGTDVPVWIEQEPGSGGKESAHNTIRNLAGFNCRAEAVTGSKEARAEPLAAQVEAGNVKLKRGPWNSAFIDEGRSFPVGQYKDQWDAASGAFNKLTAERVLRVRSIA